MVMEQPMTLERPWKLSNDDPSVVMKGRKAAKAGVMQCLREWQRMASKARSGHCHHSTHWWSSGREAVHLLVSSGLGQGRSARCRRKLCACVDCHVPKLAPSCRHDRRFQRCDDLEAPCEGGASSCPQACIGSPLLGPVDRVRRRLEERRYRLHT